MAWTRKGKGGYQAHYRDATGRVRKVHGGPFAHKAKALRLAGEAEQASRGLGWRDPDAARATWGTWLDAWWPTRDVEASTMATDVSRRDLHLIPRWADVPLSDITRHDVKAWAAQLRLGEPGGRPRSKATVERIVQLFSASLAGAVDAEVLPSNPAQRLSLGGGSPDVERYLTREEFWAAVGELEEQHRATALLLGGTGARLGEAAGMHLQRVDRERGLVKIAEVWSEKARAVKLYPKGRRTRDVPLPDWVEIPDDTGTSCGYPHPGCRSGFVLTSPEGGVANDSAFRKAWVLACREAGLGHVRVHDIRHSYASWLLQSGVSLAEVGKLLGHVSPVTTQRYAHLAEVPSDKVLSALRGPGDPAGFAADLQQPDAVRRFTLLHGEG